MKKEQTNVASAGRKFRDHAVTAKRIALRQRLVNRQIAFEAAQACKIITVYLKNFHPEASRRALEAAKFLFPASR